MAANNNLLKINNNQNIYDSNPLKKYREAPVKRIIFIYIGIILVKVLLLPVKFHELVNF